MKMSGVAKQKISPYQNEISSWHDWLNIRDSGYYSKIEVGNSFYCRDDELSSLVGSPRRVGGNFSCESNKLTSLFGAPGKVLRNFNCSLNELINLEGAPLMIGEDFFCTDNKLASLKDIHKNINFIGDFATFADNPIKSNILGLLLIKNLKVVHGDHDAFSILNKHLRGDRDVLECQEELISAGFKEYAKL